MVYGFLNTHWRASVLLSFIFAIFHLPIFIHGQVLYTFCLSFFLWSSLFHIHAFTQTDTSGTRRILKLMFYPPPIQTNYHPTWPITTVYLMWGGFGTMTDGAVPLMQQQRWLPLMWNILLNRLSRQY